MKFSCEKLILQNAIVTASRAASSKSSIPALEGLLLVCSGETLTVTGYNMQLGIRTGFACAVEEEGRLVLNARLFGDIVGLPAGEFPELPEVEEKNAFRLPEKTLRSMIQQTLFAVSSNEARPVHMGSLFDVGGGALTLVSVDGFRLALRREKLEQNAGAVPDGLKIVIGILLESGCI